MTEVLFSEPSEARSPRPRIRPLRRRRRLDLRTVAVRLAVVVGVAWTIVFGVGIVLH